MSTVWDEYVGLLAEGGSLRDQEAQQLAQAEARFQAAARRLQNDLTAAERDLKALQHRNSRLQVGVRDVTRQLDVALPSTSDSEPLTLSGISESLKSAEYDLGQLRTSLEHFKQQKAAAAAQPSVVAAAAPVQTVPQPEPAPEPARRRPIVLVAGLALVALLVIVLLIVAL